MIDLQPREGPSVFANLLRKSYGGQEATPDKTGEDWEVMIAMKALEEQKIVRELPQITQPVSPKLPPLAKTAATHILIPATDF